MNIKIICSAYVNLYYNVFQHKIKISFRDILIGKIVRIKKIWSYMILKKLPLNNGVVFPLITKTNQY